MFSLYLYEFPQGSLFYSRLQKHAGRWIGDAKLPLGVCVCLHGALQWSHAWYTPIVPSVPGIDSGFHHRVSGIKCLLNMSE